MPKAAEKPQMPAYSGTVESATPDDQSSFAQPDASPRLAPARLAPVLLTAGVIAAVAGFLVFGGDSGEPPAEASPAAAFDPVASSQAQLTSEFIGDQIAEGLQILEQQLREQIRELQARVEPLHKQLAEHGQDIAAVNQQLEQFAARMDALDATVAEIDTRAQRHAARHLADGARQKVPASSVQLEPERKQKPPFRLATVEYWDREPVGVVLLNGRKRSLKEGDAVMTYKVVNLSVAERTLSLYEAATGRHFVLEAGTNYVTEIRTPQITGLEGNHEN